MIYVFRNWINKMFSEQNKVREHGLKVGRWQGPPHINTVKWYDIVSSFKVSLFIQSWNQREFVYLACLGQKNGP